MKDFLNFSVRAE